MSWLAEYQDLQSTFPTRVQGYLFKVCQGFSWDNARFAFYEESCLEEVPPETIQSLKEYIKDTRKLCFVDLENPAATCVDRIHFLLFKLFELRAKGLSVRAEIKLHRMVDILELTASLAKS